MPTMEPWQIQQQAQLDPRSFTGGPLLVPTFGEILEDGNSETEIEHRVDKVCEDLLRGRLVPAHVDQLDAAVRQTKAAHKLHRAMGAK